MTPHESIHKYVEQLYALKLKAKVYKSIDFEEQKEQFLAGLPEEMSEYVNSQRIRNISQVLHHTMVASTLNFNMGEKKGFKCQEKLGKPRIQRGRTKPMLKLLMWLTTTTLTNTTRQTKQRKKGTKGKLA